MGVIHKGLEHFLWQEFPLDTPSKDFYLAIGGGLGWMKKVLYFMQLFLQCIPFAENLLTYG